jgi:hypothetical protein
MVGGKILNSPVLAAVSLPVFDEQATALSAVNTAIPTWQRARDVSMDARFLVIGPANAR